MNKKVLLASIVSGLLVGVLTAYASSPTMKKSFKSKTDIVISDDRGSQLMTMNAGLTLKRSGQYELFFLTDKHVGFNTSGEYLFNSYGLTLLPDATEQVVPADKKLTLIETMLTQRGMHSFEELKIIKLKNKRMILIAPHYSHLFKQEEM